MKTMKTVIKSGGAIALGFCLSTAAASASWTMIDDFQSYDIGTVHGDDATDGVWTAHSNTALARIQADNGDQYLAVGNPGALWGDHRTTSRLLPTETRLAEEGGTATYFSRVRIGGGNRNLHFGLGGSSVDTNVNIPDNLYGVRVRVDRDDDGDYILRYMDGSNVTGTSVTVAESEWINVWMVVHRDETAGDSWDLYASTGTGGAGVALVEDIAFNNALSGNIASFVVSGRGLNIDDTFNGQISDIYYSSGENLTFIPEPGAAALLLGLVAGCALLRRRRR